MEKPIRLIHTQKTTYMWVAANSAFVMQELKYFNLQLMI